MKEVWKDVVGFEGLYQVSNLGRVKTVSRYVNSSHRGFFGKRLIKSKIMKPYPYGNYFGISLRKDSKYQQIWIHRLVAQAFIPNPDNLPFINHKDENPSNNCVDNLEWCTAKYNANYGNRNKRISQSRKGMKFTDEHIENMRIAGRKRVTDEFREKMRQVHKGTTLTEEHKRKIGEGVKRSRLNKE